MLEFTEDQLRGISIANKKKLIREFYANNIDRFFKDLVYTLDVYDTTGSAIKKFPEWPYLYDLIHALVDEKWLYIWKSRKVIATNTALPVFLWHVLFHEGKIDGIQSKKAEDANVLIHKYMKVTYEKLPAWKPEAIFTDCHVSVPEMHSDIYGIASGGEQVRQHSFAKIFSDEFGFQEKLEETWGSIKPIVDAGGSFAACTTPPREKNFSYMLLRNPLFKSPYGKVLQLHYSMRPDRGSDWVANAKVGTSEDDWNREQELMVVEAGVKRLLPSFTIKDHVNANLIYVPSFTLYRVWDFGFHRPAISWYQIDSMDRVAKLRELLGHNELIDTFSDRVIGQTNLNFPDNNVVDFCDIAGTQVSDKSEKTSIQILNDKGIKPRYRLVNDEDGLNIIRRKLAFKIGDRASYQVHPSCIISIDAYTFGAVYGKDNSTLRGDGLDEDGNKEKDYYLHLIDTDKYMFGNTYSVKGDKVGEQLKYSALAKPAGPPNTLAKATGQSTNPHAWMTGYQK